MSSDVDAIRQAGGIQRESGKLVRQTAGVVFSVAMPAICFYSSARLTNSYATVHMTGNVLNDANAILSLPYVQTLCSEII
jgi:hypothetical protein